MPFDTARNVIATGPRLQIGETVEVIQQTTALGRATARQLGRNTARSRSSSRGHGAAPIRPSTPESRTAGLTVQTIPERALPTSRLLSPDSYAKFFSWSATTAAHNAEDPQNPFGVSLTAQVGTPGPRDLTVFNFDSPVPNTNIQLTEIWRAVRDFDQVKLVAALEMAVRPDLEEQAFQGLSPLNYAAQEPVREKARPIMRTLIEAGARVNSIDEEFRRTPLHWAARLDDLEMVQYLTRRPDTNTNPLDLDGATPLILAAMRGRPDVYQFLKRQETVDKRLRDSRGRTALYWYEHS